MKTIKDLIPEIDDSLLERFYPHVAKNIIDFWGTTYFNEYMEKLSVNDRGTIREGFPFSVLMELQKILEAHTNKFPHYKRVYTAWV